MDAAGLVEGRISERVRREDRQTARPGTLKDRLAQWPLVLRPVEVECVRGHGPVRAIDRDRQDAGVVRLQVAHDRLVDRLEDLGGVALRQELAANLVDRGEALRGSGRGTAGERFTRIEGRFGRRPAGSAPTHGATNPRGSRSDSWRRSIRIETRLVADVAGTQYRAAKDGVKERHSNGCATWLWVFLVIVASGLLS